MIVLKLLADVESDIKKYICTRREKLSLDAVRWVQECGHCAICSASKDISLRLINQEKDGTVIYSWQDHLQDGTYATHIGLYNPDTKGQKIGWIFDQVEYVATCSINQHHTLLGFTILTSDGGNSNLSGSSGIYMAYLAEILPPNRVFSLNIERSNFLKVQFLHISVPGQQDLLCRAAHMLVFLHKESIGLYHIPLGYAGDTMIMKRQPEKEQLVKDFLWCQWDVYNQRLHYIYHQHASPPKYGEYQTVLSAIQFSKNAQHDGMIDVPLTFPVPFFVKSSKPTYIEIPLCTGIPDKSLNLEVINLENGTFCICYQPSLASIEKTRSLSTNQRSGDADARELDVVYYVSLIHHAYTLQGTVSRIPQFEASRRRLLFTWFSGFLVVSLPGFFLHLLNVSIEFDPCHHILLHKNTLSGRVVHQGGSSVVSDIYSSSSESISLLDPRCKNLRLLNYCNKDMCISGWTVLDKKTHRVYRLHLDKTALFELFVNCYQPTTRMALFHYAVVHCKDFMLIREMFEAVGDDASSCEVQELMAEFLVGSTYTSMKWQVARKVLRVVPFTVAAALRGQFEKNHLKQILSKISCQVLTSVKIGTKKSKDRYGRQQLEDTWDNLRHHLRLNQLGLLPRFLQHTFRQLLASVNDLESDSDESSVFDEESFLSRLSPALQRESSDNSFTEPKTRSWSPNSVLGPLPAFLHSNRLTRDQGTLMTLTKERFGHFLINLFEKEPKSKLQNIAAEYVACQLQQARQLCHLVWRTKKAPERLHLRPDAEGDHELFQLFQRINLALIDTAFPITEGFFMYFSSLGHQCLSPSQFLQYLDRGVFPLTEQFANQILKVPDTKENVGLKFYIISHLPEQMALDCCRNWDHPYCTKFLGLHRLSEILGKSGSASAAEANMTTQHAARATSASSSSSIPSSQDDRTFLPLDTFLARLQGENSLGDDDLKLVEQAALCHTGASGTCDLRLVNF